MIFRLIYEGSLPSSRGGSKPKDKHAIRRALHPQLAELWKQEPLAHIAGPAPFKPMTFAIGSTGRETMIFQRGAFSFVPLITQRLNLICHLDILFLRPGPPGSLVTQGGDIDNRLKTLFDALQMPDANQLPKTKPDDDESPFFCLVEDDALITRVNVETDRLLKPDAATVGSSRVMLVIEVTIKATELTWNNLDLVS